MSATHRLLSCTLFGASITVPLARDWNLQFTEPVELSDIEVRRDGFKLIQIQQLAPNTTSETVWESRSEGELWRECWDKGFQYPHDFTLTGMLALRALYLLRLYEVGADGGAAQQWRSALDEGRADWRALENLRPDLLSVPLLQQWKQSREEAGQPINSEGRAYGMKAGDSAQFDLDLVAIGEREKTAINGRKISWKLAATRACERFPDLLTGTLGGTREDWLAEMVNRLEKRQKPQARWREIRERGGGPPNKN